MSSELVPYQESVEIIPPDEGEDIDQIIEVMKRLLESKREATGTKQRDVHVKSHGCARGELNVAKDLDLTLAQGLFRTSKSFPVFVRFSNSSPDTKSDIRPDGRGLAIQVEDIKSAEFLGGAVTQDFILVNGPTFVARNVKEYLALQLARLPKDAAKPSAEPISSSAKLPSNQWRTFASIARVVTQFPQNPACYTYYSMTPYRFGKWIVKYRVTPTASALFPIAVDLPRFFASKDAMRTLLTSAIRQRPLAFKFQVQFCTSAGAMPIEDPTVLWDEKRSPWRTVGEMHLPTQDIDLLVQEGERRSFSVWNCLTAHQPLGGINRARRKVYAASAGFRTS